jgi:hypothetical protein
MLTTLKHFKQKNHKTRVWSPLILTIEWEEQFHAAIQSIQGLIDLELQAIPPKQLKDDYYAEVISSEKFYQASINNAAISDANEWRAYAMTIIADKTNHLAWEKQLNKNDKKNFQTFMQAVKLGGDFHRYSSPALLVIIETILPFFRQYILTANKERQFWGWRMPADVKKEFNNWLNMIETEIKRIQEAIAWALLVRLNAGFAVCDVTYDDSIAFIISKLADFGLIVPKSDPSSNKPLPLLPMYQRQEMTSDTYEKAINFLQLQTDEGIQKQLNKLPLFQERYLKRDIYLTPVFRTVNHYCNGRIQVVPESCVQWVPRDTRFLPRQLFQGINLRSTFFNRYAAVLAQLKIPLPDISRLDVLRLDADSFTHHPKFIQLQQERVIIEKAIHAIQKERENLSWYQSTSKTMLQTFLLELQKRLVQTTEKEAQYLAEVSDVLRGDADILTAEAVSLLTAQLQNVSDAYQQYQNHQAVGTAQISGRKDLSDIDRFEITLESVLSCCRCATTTIPENSPVLPTVADCLDKEEKYINDASEVANNILFLLKETSYTEKTNELMVILLQDIANKKTVFPAVALSILGEFSLALTTKKNSQSLQNQLRKLLQIKAQEVLCLHAEQIAFQRLHEALINASLFSSLPVLLNKRLTELSQEPAQFSYQEKRALFKGILSSTTTLKSHCAEHRAYYQETLINSTEASSDQIIFYNSWKTLCEIIIKPQYSVLFSPVYSELQKLWQTYNKNSDAATIEEIYDIVKAIAYALNKAIEKHNGQKNKLHNVYEALLPHIKILDEMCLPWLGDKIPRVYDYCKEKHALLKHESIATFSLLTPPLTQVKKVDKAVLPDLSFNVFNKNLSVINEHNLITNESLIESMANIAEQASNVFERILPNILDIQKLVDVKRVDTNSFAIAINEILATSEELIRLGQLIQCWGNKAQKELVVRNCERLVWNYCERWSAEDLNPRQDNVRQRHHQLSKPQEAILKALLSQDLLESYTKIFDLRIQVMDYKSWFSLIDVCQENKEHIVARRLTTLKNSISAMTAASLQFAAKSSGCVFTEEFELLRDRLVAEYPVKLANLKHINASMKKLLRLSDSSHGLSATFFQLSSVNQLAPLTGMQPSFFLEASAAFKRLLCQLKEKPPQNLNEIEAAEVSMQNIMALLKNMDMEPDVFCEATKEAKFALKN